MTIVDDLHRQFPAYAIGDLLGRGGFGSVYTGHHLALDRLVAIKVLPPWFADDPEVRVRFVDEARILAKLDHPHIVRVYDYAEHGNLCALVMEFLGGGTLRRIPSPVDAGKVCAVGAGVCAALEHAHRRHITHRDVKPDNVMFAGDGTLKLTDFGLAKILSGDSSRSSQGLLGTPAYMAPEQASGESVGPGADVYATALVCYELLAGELPFPSDGDLIEVAAVRLVRPPKPLAEAAPAVPPLIAQVIMAALARSAADRYRSAEAFGIALAQAAVATFGGSWIDQNETQLRDLGPIYDAARDTRPGPVLPQPLDRSLTHERVMDQDVQFSVYRPRSVVARQWYELLAFAHKTDLTDDGHGGHIDPVRQVRQEAAAHLGPAAVDYKSASTDSELPLVPGSELVFVPDVPGVEFVPRQQSFVWDDPVHKEVFRFRTEPEFDGRISEGRLSVYLGVLLIAEVAVNVTVATEGPGQEVASARPYRKVFASYSLKDLDVVSQVASYAEIFGDSFVHEANELRSSGSWDDRLARLIRDADVFQLFWSSNAMQEPFVRYEWTYALSLRRPGFVRPVYWELPFPERPDAGLPPAELGRDTFRRLPVQLTTVTAATTGPGTLPPVPLPTQLPTLHTRPTVSAAGVQAWPAPPLPASALPAFAPPASALPGFAPPVAASPSALPPSFPAPPQRSLPAAPAGGAAPPAFPGAGGSPGFPPPPPDLRSTTSSSWLRRLAVSAVAVSVVAVGATVAATSLGGGHSASVGSGAPTTSVGIGASSGNTGVSTTEAPVQQPLAALLPRSLDAATCSASGLATAPFNGAVGLLSQLICNEVPGLPGGRVTAYGFSDASSYTQSLAAFNLDAGFKVAGAAPSCPPSGAATSGMSGWTGSDGAPVAGQFVECFTASGLSVRPAYLWTFPSSHAFVVALAGPTTSLAELGSWWVSTVPG